MYLGKSLATSDADAVFSTADEATGSVRSADARMVYKLSFNMGVVEDRLQVFCIYSTRNYRRTTIEQWLDHYRESLSELAGSTAASVITAKDAADFNWSEQELKQIDSALAAYKRR